MKSDKLIIEEIIKYCNDIIDDLSYYGTDLETFYDETRFQRSCSFCLFQIGECTKKLSDSFRKKYPNVSWRKIAGLRDIIGHAYYQINLDEIWTTIIEDIPVLKKECESIVNQLK